MSRYTMGLAVALGVLVLIVEAHSAPGDKGDKDQPKKKFGGLSVVRDGGNSGGAAAPAVVPGVPQRGAATVVVEGQQSNLPSLPAPAGAEVMPDTAPAMGVGPAADQDIIDDDERGAPPPSQPNKQ